MSIEARVAERLAETLARTKNNGGVATVSEERYIPPSDFVDEFVDTVTGKTFSEVFGMAPPTGMPDLVAPVYQPEDWPVEDRAFIPDRAKFDNYVPNVAVLYGLWASVLRNNKKALLVGPTGSGKTSIQEYFCAYINQPYLRFGGRQDMESDSILGRPWVENGSMKYELGEMPKAAKKGWYIAFDEPWKTPAGIQMALQRFYEKDGVFQLDDMPGDLADKIVTPDPRCRVVLADNVVGTGDGVDKYAATLIQDGSTLNRVDVIIPVPYMELADEANMLRKSSPALSENVSGLMVKFFNLCRTSYQQGALSAAVSPRNLLAWGEMACDLRDVQAAAKMVLLERFADDTERSVVSDHYRTVFGKSL